MSFFLKGSAIGFLIAAPVGPIGVLCIRRSLAEGLRIGFATGLGAATADAAYGAVAGFGLTAVSGFLIHQKFWLGLFGNIFLCYLGIRTLASKPAAQAAEVKAGSGWLGAYLSTLVLTITNPMTILSFLGVFAGLGVGASPGGWAAGSLVLGVFLGSAFWWLLLSGGINLFRARVNSSWMLAVNRLSGAVILLFGLYGLCQLLVAAKI